jgi:hypothetical protein
MSELELKINNPWVNYLLLKAEKRKGGDSVKEIALAKKAILYVVAKYDLFEREKIIKKIVSDYPDVLQIISEQEMFEAFLIYYKEKFQNERKTLSAEEFTWINEFISDPVIRIKIERIFYRNILLNRLADKWREDHVWTISKQEKIEIVLEILKLSTCLSAERKWELAKEFGLLNNDFGDDLAYQYFSELIWQRRYFGAKEFLAANKLRLNSEKVQEIAYEILVEKMEDEEFFDAEEIAKCFLSEQKDLKERVKQIIVASQLMLCK